MHLHLGLWRWIILCADFYAPNMLSVIPAFIIVCVLLLHVYLFLLYMTICMRTVTRSHGGNKDDSYLFLLCFHRLLTSFSFSLSLSFVFMLNHFFYLIHFFLTLMLFSLFNWSFPIYLSLLLMNWWFGVDLTVKCKYTMVRMWPWNDNVAATFIQVWVEMYQTKVSPAPA